MCVRVHADRKCVCVMQYSLCESTTVMLITALLEGSSLLLSSSNQSLQNWKKKKNHFNHLLSAEETIFIFFFFSWHSSCALSRSVFSASHKIKSCGISSFVTLHLADKQAENWACAYLPRHFVLFLSNASRSLLEPLPLYRYWTVCIVVSLVFQGHWSSADLKAGEAEQGGFLYRVWAQAFSLRH